MGSQGVPRLADLFTLGALMCEAIQMSLNMLFHGVPKLAGEMTLGTLPDSLSNHWVIGRDQEFRYLQLQLVEVGSVLLGGGGGDGGGAGDGQRRGVGGGHGQAREQGCLGTAALFANTGVPLAGGAFVRQPIGGEQPGAADAAPRLLHYAATPPGSPLTFMSNDTHRTMTLIHFVGKAYKWFLN